jgi:hypothetical protein
MYELVKTLIGVVPREFEIIYGIGTYLMFIMFLLLLFSPFIMLFKPFKRRKGVM